MKPTSQSSFGWTSEMGVSYSVIIEQQAAASLFISGTAIQMTLGYNIQ